MKKLLIIIIILGIGLFTLFYPARKVEVWVSDPITSSTPPNEPNPGHFEDHSYNIYGFDIDQFKDWLISLLPFNKEDQSTNP